MNIATKERRNEVKIMLVTNDIEDNIKVSQREGSKGKDISIHTFNIIINVITECAVFFIILLYCILKER